MRSHGQVFEKNFTVCAEKPRVRTRSWFAQIQTLADFQAAKWPVSRLRNIRASIFSEVSPGEHSKRMFRSSERVLMFACSTGHPDGEPKVKPDNRTCCTSIADQEMWGVKAIVDHSPPDTIGKKLCRSKGPGEGDGR